MKMPALVKLIDVTVDGNAKMAMTNIIARVSKTHTKYGEKNILLDILKSGRIWSRYSWICLRANQELRNPGH